MGHGGTGIQTAGRRWANPHEGSSEISGEDFFAGLSLGSACVPHVVFGVPPKTLAFPFAGPDNHAGQPVTRVFGMWGARRTPLRPGRSRSPKICSASVHRKHRRISVSDYSSATTRSDRARRPRGNGGFYRRPPGSGISSTGTSFNVRSSVSSKWVVVVRRQFSIRAVKQVLLMMAGLGKTRPMICAPLAGIAGFLAQFASARRLGRSVARVNHPAGNFQFDGVGAMAILFDQDHALVGRERNDVDPIDRVNNKKLVVLARARRALLHRINGEDLVQSPLAGRKFSARARSRRFLLGRDNFDALDATTLDRPAFLAAAPIAWSGCRPTCPEHRRPAITLPKAVYLPVQKTGVGQADKELAAGGIRILRARHGNDAANVGPVVELGLDLVAGIARAPTTLRGRIPASADRRPGS